MIGPRYLIQDLTRALSKLGLRPSVAKEGESWSIEGSDEGRHVKITLTSYERVVPGLEVLGPIPVSQVRVVAEGPGEFISALRYRLEVELLRCLG